MSFKAAAWAIETDRVQTAHERLVLIILADCHNAESGRCDPSIEFVAQRACISRRSVERTLAALEERGVVSRIQRTNSSGMKVTSSYQLHIHDASDSRIDASHSRTGCVTQSPTDASGCRINQESLNQEKNQGARARARVSQPEEPITAETSRHYALVAERNPSGPAPEVWQRMGYASFEDYCAGRRTTDGQVQGDSTENRQAGHDRRSDGSAGVVRARQPRDRVGIPGQGTAPGSAEGLVGAGGAGGAGQLGDGDGGERGSRAAAAGLGAGAAGRTGADAHGDQGRASAGRVAPDMPGRAELEPSASALRVRAR